MTGASSRCSGSNRSAYIRYACTINQSRHSCSSRSNTAFHGRRNTHARKEHVPFPALTSLGHIMQTHTNNIFVLRSWRYTNTGGASRVTGGIMQRLSSTYHTFSRIWTQRSKDSAARSMNGIFSSFFDSSAMARNAMPRLCRVLANEAFSSPL